MGGLDLASEIKGGWGQGKNQNLYYLEDVNVQFTHLTALKKVNLKVSLGEFIFLTGPSGAGKTTLLRVLAEEVLPSSGRFLNFFNAQSSKVGRIFQDLRLINQWTVEENLALAFDHKIYKSRQKFNEDLLEYAQMLSFKTHLKTKIHEVNGGLRQKVAIVRCLLKRPSVILADEPTSSLDKEQTLRVYDLLKLLTKRRPMTIIWASHNAELVRQMQGKVIHLDQGKLIYSGNACFI